VVGLFPGGEVAASVKPVVVEEIVRIRALRPASRGLVELVGEDADRDRDRDVLWVFVVWIFVVLYSLLGYLCVRETV
jgi:hypothetical protein